jgi:glycosyltransferase involved in cell wall biosynthesis
MKTNKIQLVENIHGVPAYAVNHLKSKKFDYALVVPVLNENGRLLEQLGKIKNLLIPVDLLIVDGGSNDGSTELEALKKLGVTSLLVKLGEGKLSAQLRAAFHYSTSVGYKGVVTMDGNNKDNAHGIETILNSLLLGYDFIQGSRFIAGGQAINTPKMRYFAIRFFHAPLTSMAAGFKFTDTTNGFRGYSSRLLTNSQVSIFREVFNSYELSAYLPIRAAKLQFKVTEVPVTRTYPRNTEIPTKIKGLKAHIAMIKILLNAISNKYNP